VQFASRTDSQSDSRFCSKGPFIVMGTGRASCQPESALSPVDCQPNVLFPAVLINELKWLSPADCQPITMLTKDKSLTSSRLTNCIGPG
jgi:hypothetical protein